MTHADQVRASDTDQDPRKPLGERHIELWERHLELWERYLDERRRLGPALTDAQRDELRALGHQLLNPALS